MSNYKYIKTPTSILFNEIQENNCCFAPSKYSRFTPNKDLEYMTLDELITESVKKTKIDKKFEYKYSEIGDINVENGFVENNGYYGINIPSDNPKSIQQHDIVISTVRTYRGGIGYVTDSNKNQCCSPAMIVIRDVKPAITKEYLFAVLRNEFFIEQVLGFLNRGMYPRLDKEAMKQIVIPMPKGKSTLDYITILVKAYLNKIKLIKERHQAILALIEQELLDNQKDNTFSFNLPTIKEIESIGRLDTNLYRANFKELVFIIKNYAKGFKTIQELGFSLSRGQNLQISNIGSSIYSKKKHKNFYTLILPKFISKYGTVDSIEYLGNSKCLKTLKKGDLIFGAEGFEKGRSIVIIEEQEKVITNIHGITIQQEEHNANKAIYVKCILDYFRNKGLIDLYAVGGNGGSLAQKYWDIIPFPNFSTEKQQEIAKLYHNPIAYDVKNATLDNFLALDDDFNSQAGIYELDKTAKQFQAILNQAIESIIENKPVDMKFNL